MSFNNFEKYIYIEIEYKPNEKNENKVRIFGTNFINNNKEKCLIIYNEIEYQLKEYFEEIDNNYNHKDTIKLILKIIDQIEDISHIFCECSSLKSFSYILYFYNDNSNDIAYESNSSQAILIDDINESNNSDLFNEYNSLILSEEISTISKKWNSNITTENNFFDINLSTFTIFSSKINNMSYMFYECNSLISLPDISDWITENVTDMSNLFYGCNSLMSLPDISKWNTINVKDMSKMFYQCNSLLVIPDISKWNIKNVISLNGLFSECSSLMSLPDISKWNTININFMDGIFDGCSSLAYLPDNLKNNIWEIFLCYTIYQNGTLQIYIV